LFPGVQAEALTPLPYRQAHEGDRPLPDLTTMAEQIMGEARVDPVAARQLLNMFTYSCSTLDRFEGNAPSSTAKVFLPSTTELGRADLL
jgi:hypothetical protein